MATTVTAAPLTYTLSESITLAGSDRGSSFKKTVNSSLVEYSRIVRNILPTTFMTVATFGHTPLSSGSDFDVDEVKYIRITNLDDADAIAISLDPESVSAITLNVPAGMTFLFGSPLSAFADSETVPFRDIQRIRVRALGSSNVDVEVVIGSL